MKPILFLLMFVSLTVAQKPAPPKDRLVLFDFRNERTETSGKVPPATTRNVLSKVFRKYLTDQGQCSSSFNAGNAEDYLGVARKAGQLVPSIVDSATGSFTASGQTETAYVIWVGECNASHADNFGTKRVAIFSGPRLIADVDVDFKSTILRKLDLNGDGIDELLMTTGDMAQGTVTEMAEVVNFQNGKHNVIYDFGVTLLDDCASLAPGSTSKAAVLYTSLFTPGSMPKFTQDNYSATCRKAKRWRFVSSGKMPE
jgi:hypothetical protein